MQIRSTRANQRLSGKHSSRQIWSLHARERVVSQGLGENAQNLQQLKQGRWTNSRTLHPLSLPERLNSYAHALFVSNCDPHEYVVAVSSPMALEREEDSTDLQNYVVESTTV